MTNIADTFAHLQKWLHANWAARGSEKSLHNEFVTRRTSLRRSVRVTRTLPVPALADMTLIECLVLCGLIDSYFEHVTHGSPPPWMDSWLEPCRDQLAAQGYYNSDTSSGLVIPRRPLHGHFSDKDAAPLPLTGGPADWFANLLWLPPRIASFDPDGPGARAVGLRYRIVPENQAKAPSTTNWKVAFIPIAQTPSEYTLTGFSNRKGDPVYSIKPAKGVNGTLADRLEQAILLACDNACNIIAMPELVLTHALHKRVEKTLRNLSDRQREDLILVLAGTRPGKAKNGEAPPNEAVVFDHAGETLLTQHKLSGWDFAQGKSRIYGLTEPSHGKSRNEHLTPGKTLEVMEYPGLGRIAVLICEDLRKAEPGVWLRNNMALELQFTPVLSQGLGWVYGKDEPVDVERDKESGLSSVTMGRCRVISANSMFMRTRLNELNRKRGELKYVEHVAEIGVLMERDCKLGSECRAEIPLAEDGTLSSEPLVKIREFGGG